MTKYEQMSNLMITRPRSELAKFAKRYRISMAKEAAMGRTPIIAPGKEDTFLSKIVPSSANESEITYKVTQQLIEVYYATADQKKKNSCRFCYYLRATLQRKSFFSLYHPKSMQLENMLQ